MKFEFIKHRWNGSVLFSLECESLKLCVVAAVKSGVNLSGADLSRANLFRADLSRADLSRANLSGVNLSRADLFRANLSGADLSGADLSWANLSRADLSRADLFGANLFGANLSGAENVTAKRTTPLALLLDQPGPIRAYKLVTKDGVGPFNGGLTYAVGESYVVDNADTDESHSCGAGINLASWSWCLSGWRDGYRILVAEFEAPDIACIPIGSDGKFRVHRCRIVAEADIGELSKEGVS